MPEGPGAKSKETEATAPEEVLRPPASVNGREVVAAKADLSKRAVAAIIDAVPAVVVGMLPILGGVFATAYWLFRDGLDLEFMPRRSLGKKLVGLQAVTMDGQPVDLATSIMRNWPFALGGVAQILLFIPFVGWLLMIPVTLAALALVLYEVFQVFTREDGRRLGDRMAGTRVIEVASA